MWRAIYVHGLGAAERAQLAALAEGAKVADYEPGNVSRLGPEDLVVVGRDEEAVAVLEQVRSWREGGLRAPVVVLAPGPLGPGGLLDLGPIQLVSTLDREQLDHARLHLELQLQQAARLQEALVEVRQLEELSLGPAGQRGGLSQHLDAIETAEEILGLRSERAMARSISEAFNLARRHQTPLACLLIAVDDFTTLEKEFGEAFADFVLVQVAHRLRTEMRQTDLLSRYSSGRLLMLSPFTDADGVRLLVGRLQRAVQGQRLEREGRKIEVTVSVGVSTWKLDVESSSALVETAAAALEEATLSGRGGCHVV